ncbi:hypothetical protein [Bacillus smithii]|uniref:hypothetical protein n=1 Tax=Bacillus smithii TaxID=1479 RepID=UPI003D1DCB63
MFESTMTANSPRRFKFRPKKANGSGAILWIKTLRFEKMMTLGRPVPFTIKKTIARYALSERLHNFESDPQGNIFYFRIKREKMGRMIEKGR